jgi:hypothetical protein
MYGRSSLLILYDGHIGAGGPALVLAVFRNTLPIYLHHEYTLRVNERVQLENIEEGMTISCNTGEAIDPRHVQRKRQKRLFKQFAQELIETAFPPKTNLRQGKA